MAEADRDLTDNQKKQVDAAMDRYEAELISKARGTKRQLEEELAAQGLTLQEMRDRERRDATVRAYLGTKYRPTRQYTKRELWEEYSGNRDSYDRDTRVLLRVMVAPFAAFGAKADAAARSAARSALEAAAAEVRGGKDFGKAASDLFMQMQKRHGDKAGAIWGFLPGSTHLKAMALQGGLWQAISVKSIRDVSVRAAVGKLEEGQVSGVVAGDQRDRFYLVKVQRLRPAVENFEQAQRDVRIALETRDYRQWEWKYLKTLLDDHRRVHGRIPPADRRTFVRTVLQRALR